MSDRLDVMELMRSANPVSLSEVPDPGEAELMVMEEIIRSSVVPPRVREEERVTSGDVVARGLGLRGPLVALASFLLVAAVGVALWLTTGDELDGTAASAGPVGTPLEVEELWESAMNRGDLDGLMALYADDVSWTGGDKAALRRFFEGRMALNVRYELTDCREVGVTLTCRWTFTDDLVDAAAIGPLTGSMTFTIHSGFIREFDAPLSATSTAAWDRVTAFLDWASRTRPELAAQVSARGPGSDELRSQLIIEWLTLGVVEEWQRTINEGDLDAFMALYAEGATFGTFNRAGIRGFFGWRIALNARYEATDCQVDGDAVTCDWSSTDDFFQRAGVDALAGSMTFTLQNGLIQRLADEPTPGSLADWNRVLAEFGAWVQDTHPELLEQLHGFTPETAELQLQLVEEWLESD